MKKNSEYFIYGISVPYNWYQEWEEKHKRNFHSAFADYLENDGNEDERLVCFFDHYHKKFMILGRILPVVNDGNPVIVPELDYIDKFDIENLVEMFFDLKGAFQYYFVKKNK